MLPSLQVGTIFLPKPFCPAHTIGTFLVPTGSKIADARPSLRKPGAGVRPLGIPDTGLLDVDHDQQVTTSYLRDLVVDNALDGT